MVIELKRGYTVDSWYDKFTDSYITRLLDPEGNQIRDALYSGDIVGRNYDIQSVKDFFVTYMKDPNFNPEPIEDFENEDSIQEHPVNEETPEEMESTEEENPEEEEPIEEALDPELEKRARRTRRATKKSKLPALSKMSPIMPDYGAGIDKFNSFTADGNSGMASTTGSTGLGEAWMTRPELIGKLKGLGFNYKFDKYSDKALYRIYQERLRKVEKQKAEKKAEQQRADLNDQKKENAKDSYFKNGIEFESEDAAREYFGESMDNKFYINDMHIAWDLEEDYDVKKKQLTESLVVENSLESKAAGILQAIIEADPDDAISMLIGFYMRDPELDDDEAEDLAQAAYENNDLIDELIWQLDNAGELKEFVDENTFYEGLKVKHNFRTITEGLHFFEQMYFNEKYADAQMEVMFESMRDKLSSEDIKKLGSFMNHAQDADEVLTYMRGLLTKNQKLSGNGQQQNESLKEDYVEDPREIVSQWSDSECREWLWDHYDYMVDMMNSDLDEEEYEDIGIQDEDDYERWMYNLSSSDLHEIVVDEWYAPSMTDGLNTSMISEDFGGAPVEAAPTEVMHICDACLQAIKSRGEKLWTGDTEYYDNESGVCDWCGEEGFDSLIEASFSDVF